MQTTYVRQTTEGRSSLNSSTTPNAPVLNANASDSSSPARARASLFKSRSSGPGNGDRALIEALAGSKVFQDYEKAFTEATGLPVALRPVETWQLPHHGKRNEGPFCSLI